MLGELAVILIINSFNLHCCLLVMVHILSFLKVHIYLVASVKLMCMNLISSNNQILI